MARSITSTVKKGRHTRLRWPCRVSHLKCYVIFTDSCRYEHGDGDQWDWNKAVGVKEKFFQPMHNSIMLGWRWHPKKKKIQVVPYVHKDGEVEYDSFDIIELNIGDAVYFEVSEQGIHYGDYDIIYLKTWEPKWLIVNWFGGQKKAPHDLTLKIEML